MPRGPLQVFRLPVKDPEIQYESSFLPGEELTYCIGTITHGDNNIYISIHTFSQVFGLMD